jgi:hypothetical protein
MKRRLFLTGSLPLALPPSWAAAAQALATEEPAWRMATAWRVAGTSSPDTGDRVGVFRVDWAAGRLEIQSQQAVPSRAHGLLSLADGGFMAAAARPGRWLMRCDAQGEVVRRWSMTDDTPERSFDGHVEASADGAWLYTVETDPATGAGWISVRDTVTLQRVAQFRSGGIDPHQILRAPDGHLVVANGGIVRDPLGRRIASERMDSSLVRLDGSSGRLLGQWRLPDAHLSLRHIAWAQGPDPLLGIGLQAETCAARTARASAAAGPVGRPQPACAQHRRQRGRLRRRHRRRPGRGIRAERAEAAPGPVVASGTSHAADQGGRTHRNLRTGPQHRRRRRGPGRSARAGPLAHPSAGAPAGLACSPGA